MLASVWLMRSLSQPPLYGPVSQSCTMENSKRGKGNSRWPGPVMLVQLLPLSFLKYPRATWRDFHPRHYIFPVAIVERISLAVKYILYRFSAIAGKFNRPYGCRVIAISSPVSRPAILVFSKFRCYLRAILQSYSTVRDCRVSGISQLRISLSRDKSTWGCRLFLSLKC